MLLDNEDARQFIPTKLLKKNKFGAYVNGIWMVVILSGSIILAQVLVPNADTVLRQLTQLNSVYHADALSVGILCVLHASQTFR